MIHSLGPQLLVVILGVPDDAPFRRTACFLIRHQVAELARKPKVPSIVRCRRLPPQVNSVCNLALPRPINCSLVASRGSPFQNSVGVLSHRGLCGMPREFFEQNRAVAALPRLISSSACPRHDRARSRCGESTKARSRSKQWQGRVAAANTRKCTKRPRTTERGLRVSKCANKCPCMCINVHKCA